MLIRSLLGHQTYCYSSDNFNTISDIINFIRTKEHLPDHVQLRLEINGRPVSDDDEAALLNNTSNVTVTLSGGLPGGKGGFGSLLRSIGAQIEKTTNHEAMR